MEYSDNKISIVITCYNEGKLLKRAIESVEGQIDKDFELIVVNDASPCEIINRICCQLEKNGKARVVWHNENKGLSAARNSGYKAMQGNICIPLDADDVLPQDAVLSVRKAFQNNPKADFVFGNYIRKEPESNYADIVDCSILASSKGFLDPERLIIHDWILYGGSPCRKRLWKRIGGYALEFSYDVQDVDFWKRALISGAKGYYLNKTIYEWRRSGDGMNASVPIAVLRRERKQNIKFYELFSKSKTALNKATKIMIADGFFFFAAKFVWLSFIRYKNSKSLSKS